MHWSYASVHGVRIQVPWDENLPQYGKIHFAFGKGTRQQILNYAEANCPQGTRWQIENYLKGNNPDDVHVGIDCNGFVYRMLEEAAQLSGAPSLVETMGTTCEFTPLDALTPANQLLSRAIDVQAGDTLRFHEGRHSGVILEVVTDAGGTLKEIWYAHSSYTRGPHIGWIAVGDPYQGLKAPVQNWYDDMWDGLANNYLRDLYFTSVHHSPFYQGLRPKVVKMTGITLTLNGRAIAFQVPPFVLAGRTFCQIRPLAEAMGCQVTWDQGPQMVTISRGTRTAQCQVGSEVGLVGGSGYALDEPPIFVGQNVLVPVRFLAEAMGYKVSWDQIGKVVALTLA
jgi:hypothetical protein